LIIEGEKMSKSLGNFFTLRDLIMLLYRLEHGRLQFEWRRAAVFGNLRWERVECLLLLGIFEAEVSFVAEAEEDASLVVAKRDERGRVAVVQA